MTEHQETLIATTFQLEMDADYLPRCCSRLEPCKETRCHLRQTERKINRTVQMQSPSLQSLLSILKPQYLLLVVILLNTLSSNVCHGLVTTRAILNSGPEEFRDKRAFAEPNSFRTLWANSTIPYVFDKAFPLRVKRQTVKAMCLWMRQTHCIRFVQRTTEPFFIKFMLHENDPSSCNSLVGRLNFPDLANIGQMFMLGMQCNRGNVAHEIGHTLGFYHEHQRADRDNFVFINYTNIRNRPEILRRFEIELDTVALDTEYDFGSIMHYPTNRYSVNGYDTIVPLLPYSGVIGQRKRLSPMDREQVNDVYQCEDVGANKAMMPLDANIIQDGDWIILHPYYPTNVTDYHPTLRLECGMNNCSVNKCAGKFFKYNDVTKCPGNLIQIVKSYPVNDTGNDKAINFGDKVFLKWDLSPGKRALYCPGEGNCSLSHSCSRGEGCSDSGFIIQSPGKNSTERINHLNPVSFHHVTSQKQFGCSAEDQWSCDIKAGQNNSFLLQKY